VRVQNGSLALISGPAVEPNEQMITLFFIQARDLNEAIRVAAQLPQAGVGAIVVQPTTALEPETVLSEEL
jgi:hypothetical protein